MSIDAAQISRFIRVGLFASVLALLVKACWPSSPQERLAAYNKKLGPQAELTETHLIVRSPGNVEQNIAPVELRIPKLYLAGTPVYKNDKTNEIEEVYINFTFPEGTPWKGGVGYYREKMILTLYMKSVFGEQSGDRSISMNEYWPDGYVAGLNKFTEYSCYDVENNADYRKWVSQKDRDDPTPENCRMYRNRFDLIDQENRKPESIAIRCRSGGCDAFFRAGRRMARFPMVFAGGENIDDWQQRMKVAQKLVDDFIVQNQNMPAN